MIYIYVNGGKIPAKAMMVITQMEEILGKQNLRILGNANISYHVFNQATQISKYCKKEDSGFVGKTILWIVKKKQSYVVRKAMEDGIGFVSLKNIITKNRVLKRNWK